jgi:glucose/arabinose dehydrogenase
MVPSRVSADESDPDIPLRILYLTWPKQALHCSLSRESLRFIRSIQFIAVFIFQAIAYGAVLPQGFTEVAVASGLSRPTAMAFAPDGRLFVLEQDGDCRVIKNGQLLAQPFLSISVENSGERGLLGIAFDPGFSSNRWVYFYHTVPGATLRNRITRWTANGDTALPGSDVVIKEFEPLTAVYHNGGAIHFGADGKLYVGVGDNARSAMAQSLESTFGKILRLNSDGSIPADNPFCGTQELKCAIWALGLRNPFTFAIQQGTGRIYINDVGSNFFEEINEGFISDVDPALVRNYGWPLTEGVFDSPEFPGFRNPVHAYGRGGAAGECAITGGAFYNSSVPNFPSLYTGKYFFADVCAGWIKTIDPATKSVQEFASGIDQAIDLQAGPEGALYYLGREFGGTEAGAVLKITAVTNAPSITQAPENATVRSGTSVTFSVTATGTGTLSYRWQRNGTNIAGATSRTYTISSPQAADNGATFRAVVTNSFGSTPSAAARLTVTTSEPPVGVIPQPAAGTLYSAGDTIAYAGSATDAEDGALPAPAFNWQVLLHHDTHTHPFVPPTAGVKAGTFTIPTTDHTEDNVWYRIYLTVTDSSGAKQTVTRDVLPRKSQITILTNPPGLSAAVDGVPQSTPSTVTSVVGVKRMLSAPQTQTINGATYVFSSWSDGKPNEHEISTPLQAAVYTANYRLTGSCATVTGSGGSLGSAVSGGAGVLQISAAGSCVWSSSSDVSWLQVYPLSGSGASRLEYTIYPNFSTQARTGKITVGDKTITVLQAASPKTYNERFVERMYFATLGRLPSAAELAFQVNVLAASSPSALFLSFFNSLEFNLGGRYAAALYVALLDRDAEYGGWLFQRNALTTGVTNPPALADAFLNSEEFLLKFGPLNDESLVRFLYRFVLLREASPQEVGFHAAGLRSGISRAQLASAFLNSEEFRVGTGPRLTAFLLYALILQRDPTALELNQMAGQVEADVPLASLVNSLLSSVAFEVSMR